MTCLTCAKEYWLHPHCPDCHRDWYGQATCHCVSCHQTFSSDRAFLMHQLADECQEPATRGLKQVDRKGGPVWVRDEQWSQEAVRASRVEPGASKKKRVA
jgi:hypothetical protein